MTARVRYIVHDVDAAIGFYRDRLGFDLDMHPAPGFAALTRGDLQLLLNAVGAGGAGRAGGTPQPGGWNLFQIEVSGIEAIVQDLRAAEVTVRGDIVDGNAVVRRWWRIPPVTPSSCSSPIRADQRSRRKGLAASPAAERLCEGVVTVE